MFLRTLKVIIAVFFIPVVIASTKAFLKAIVNVSIFNFDLFLIIGGFLAYPIFHIVFFKPMYIYALGHEIVHVLATWICGGKVTSFHISSAGGSVTTTKTNIFIRLSPYFVPIHMIFLSLAYWGLSQFYNMSGFSREFIFLVGFTMSFHIFMTIDVMKIQQPDIMKTGYLFSVLLIYVANVFVAILVLSLIFSDISLAHFAKMTFNISKNIYLKIFYTLT